VSKVPWDIQFHAAFEAWTASLVQADAEALLAALRVLRDEGPTLGRPLVDSVVGSRHSNMKELRPGSTGRTEVRVLFAFEKLRRAIFLVGGDKSDDWRGWYARNIAVADDRFDDHQAQLAKAADDRKANGRQPNVRGKGRAKR